MINRTGSKSNGITEGIIWKQLLAFFFPILFGTFFQQLYNTVDAIVVGNYLGKEALAAVGGATGTLINLLVGFFTGLASGATVVLSQFYGAKQDENVHKAIHTAATLALTGSVFLMIIGFFGTPFALKAMGTPEDIMEYSVVYLRTYFAGIVFPLLYNIGSGILRAIGDSKSPLYFLIVCCIVNLVLDVVFVVFLGMGVFGVALATVIAQAVSALLIVAMLMKTSGAILLFPTKIRFTGPILKSMIVIGLPASLQSILSSLSKIVIQSSVNSFGTNSVAAWTAYGKTDGIFWMMINAFGIAITIFVGQNFGAQKYDRVKKSVHICLAMSIFASVVMSGIIMLFGRHILTLFTSDQDVLSIGVDMIRLMVPFFAVYAFIEIYSGACRGAGDSLIPMIMNCIGICVLRVVWIWVAVPIVPTLSTALMSYPVTWIITALLFGVYYYKGGWMKRRMKQMKSTQK